MLENLDESIADKKMLKGALSVQIALQKQIMSPINSDILPNIATLTFPPDNSTTELGYTANSSEAWEKELRYFIGEYKDLPSFKA